MRVMSRLLGASFVLLLACSLPESNRVKRAGDRGAHDGGGDAEGMRDGAVPRDAGEGTSGGDAQSSGSRPLPDASRTDGGHTAADDAGPGMPANCGFGLPRPVATSGCELHSELEDIDAQGSADRCGVFSVVSQSAAKAQGRCGGGLDTSAGGVIYERATAAALPAEGLTVDAWVWANSVDDSEGLGPVIAAHEGGAFRLFLDRGVPAAAVGLPCAGDKFRHLARATSSLQPKRWTHIQGTFHSTGGGTQISVDGARANNSSAEYCQADPISTENARIDLGELAGQKRFDGVIDAVRVRRGLIVGEPVTGVSAETCMLDETCLNGSSTLPRVRDWTGRCTDIDDCGKLYACLEAAQGGSCGTDGTTRCRLGNAAPPPVLACDGSAVALAQCQDRVANSYLLARDASFDCP